MANLITIDQLLESVDLDFEPGFVTKDANGTISIFKEHPERCFSVWTSAHNITTFGKIKLAEFADKSWIECIYEVPRKTPGKIEKLDLSTPNNKMLTDLDQIKIKINELVGVVNELKGVKNE